MRPPEFSLLRISVFPVNVKVFLDKGERDVDLFSLPPSGDDGVAVIDVDVDRAETRAAGDVGALRTRVLKTRPLT
jgi:hypothetical protein